MIFFSIFQIPVVCFNLYIWYNTLYIEFFNNNNWFFIDYIIFSVQYIRELLELIYFIQEYESDYYYICNYSNIILDYSSCIFEYDNINKNNIYLLPLNIIILCNVLINLTYQPFLNIFLDINFLNSMLFVNIYSVFFFKSIFCYRWYDFTNLIFCC